MIHSCLVSKIPFLVKLLYDIYKRADEYLSITTTTNSNQFKLSDLIRMFHFKNRDLQI